MPVQLPLLAEKTLASPWSQLPEQARSEVVELFAELLVSNARRAPSVEEPEDESLEDTTKSRES